jgi:c-di-GMP-binding flagellar brake protein YcgR
MEKNQPADTNQRITHPGQIAAILRRFLEELTLLSVRFPGEVEIFNSAVLRVDPEENCLYLDELNPRPGHDRVEPGIELQVEGRLQGVETHFIVSVTDIRVENGIYLYRTVLPTYIIHRQRREDHRVPVRLTLQGGISLTSQENPIRARLSDLSAGGFGGVVTDGSALEEGMEYDCAIQLGENEIIDCKVEIRFTGIDRKGHQRFGAMFVDLSQQKRRRIERLVMELERGLRRTT